jgi:pilus assembly protein CpaE
MERPTVLLALGAEAWSYRPALEAAGFDVTFDLGVLEHAGLATAPSLAVLDCDVPDAEQAYRLLHVGTPVPTIMLIGDDLPEWAVGDSESAARDEYAIKPTPADAVVYRLQALMIRRGLTTPADALQHAAQGANADEVTTIGEGHVVSLFAPKGGVGKTTIAVNLAVALREQSRAGVLLLDADVGVGNVSAVLDAPYRMGLSDLSDSPPEEWTDAAFEAATSKHAASGVNVLTWGTDPAESERVSVELLLAAVKWGRSHFSYVIIDNHPSYDDRTMAMLAVSREIFLVVTPEVGPIRNAAQFLGLARELGLRDSVRVIVNRANHGVSAADVADALGMPVAATVVSNGPKAVTAANEGTPLVLRFPKERVSTDMHNIARLLTQTAAEPVTAKPRPWWAFATRASQA